MTLGIRRLPLLSAVLRTPKIQVSTREPGPAEVVPVRLDPHLRAAVTERAEAQDTSTSDIIRRALGAILDVA